MERKNYLKFSNGEITVSIYVDGEIVLTTSKEEDALKMLLELLAEEKINAAEHQTMVGQIQDALLETEDMDMFVLVGMGFLDFNAGFVTFFSVSEENFRFEKNIDRPIPPNESYFEICEACALPGIHGHIHFSSGDCALILMSQKEALAHLEEGKRRGYLKNPEEFDNVKKQIKTAFTTAKAAKKN